MTVTKYKCSILWYPLKKIVMILKLVFTLVLLLYHVTACHRGSTLSLSEGEDKVLCKPTFVIISGYIVWEKGSLNSGQERQRHLPKGHRHNRKNLQIFQFVSVLWLASALTERGLQHL